ncbi:MAG: beta-glucosidase, partial [Mangrovimonas sp.]|nr:beta-glucosidase [Mangrovimonas sp.]
MKYFYKYVVALSLIPAMVSCKFDKKEIAISNDVSAKSHWTDEQLLDTIQYQTFEYFWEGAEPNSGMARERLHMD